MKRRKYGENGHHDQVVRSSLTQGMGAYALMACRAKERRLPFRFPRRHFLQSLDV
jgi:hypothetical protein